MECLNLCTATRENRKIFDQCLSNLKNKKLGLPWAYCVKSEIYAAREDFQNAIKEAKRSIEIAMVVGSENYQIENTSNIEKWKKE